MRRIAPFAILAVVSGCGSSYPPSDFQYAGPATPPAPSAQPPANAQTIEAAVTGKTLVAIVSDGSHWAPHLKPNGLYDGYAFPAKPPAAGQQWSFDRGTWRADLGRLCFRSEQARQESCVKVVLAPGLLHAYSEKDGSWRFSAELRPDNPFSL